MKSPSNPSCWRKVLPAVLVALLTLAATPLRAQYFDWVRTYQSTVGSGTGSPDLDNMVLDMDADSRGNVYFIGNCVRGAAINGEELLGEVSHSAHPHNHKSTCIVKMSPNGEMVWHKAISDWNAETGYGRLQVVGDSSLVCYVIAHRPFDANNPVYWIDSLFQYPDWVIPTDSIGIHGHALLTFDLDGHLKEQHFLHIGMIDSLGEPIVGHNTESMVASESLVSGSMHIDSEGNIILSSLCWNDKDYRRVWCDTCEPHWQGVEYSVENGGVGAVRIMVDGRRSFFHYPENRPIKTNAKLLKFSPHFDSLLEVRYLMQSRLDSPRTGLGVPGITDSQILHITSDPEGNIYVVGEIHANTDTIVPIDSIQGMSLHVNNTPTGFLVKYDSHLRPIFFKDLDYDGLKFTNFTDCVVEGENLFTLVCAGKIEGVYSYDGVPLRDINRGTTFFRLSKEDGRLLSYGTARPKNIMEGSCSVSPEETTLTVRNNRVATQVKFLGNVAFAGDTIYSSASSHRGTGFVIWDYEGHQLKIVDCHTPHPDNRIRGTLFTDSSLYLCGMFNGEATFGDTYFNVSRSNGYIARYVDTSFLHPYVHHEPVAVPRAAAAEREPFFTLSPNPATGRVRVEIHTPSPLRGTPPNLGGEPGTCSLAVRDAAGHEVMYKVIPPVQTALDLDLSDLPAGAYFVTLTTPTATGTQRLVVW